MWKKTIVFLSTLVLITVFSSKNAVAQRSEPLIIGHSAVQEFNNIPDWAIENAKDQFYGVYFHTSHGSQIFTGMDVLMNNNSLYDYFNDRSHYRWPGNPVAPDGDLSMWDWNGTDLGNPSRTAWVNTTRVMLDNSNDDYQIYPHFRNLVMWSWCGQVSSASADDIRIDYLENMNRLEQNYPNIAFIYMTGHLDGTGEQGNLNQRNEQIRNYVKSKRCQIDDQDCNERVLFDFADIESYDPDGNYYLDQGADDQCNYYDDDDDSYKNWADEWCADNLGNDLCTSCGTCAHSHCLNCNMKGRAFWWMMAKLAGWEGEASPLVSPSPSPSPSPSISPLPGCTLPGDANCDEQVNIDDLLMILENWGGSTDGDVNNDEVVNVMDVIFVLENWG